MGKQDGSRGNPNPVTRISGRECPWGLTAVVVAVVAVLGVFVAVVAIDLGSEAASGPPDGVEEFEVEQGHTPNNSVDYAQSPPVGG